MNVAGWEQTQNIPLDVCSHALEARTKTGRGNNNPQSVHTSDIEIINSGQRLSCSSFEKGNLDNAPQTQVGLRPKSLRKRPAVCLLTQIKKSMQCHILCFYVFYP